MNYLQQNIDITKMACYMTKATARYFFEINNLDDVFKIKEIQDFAKDSNLRILFLGGGKNTLFAFDEFEGIIIKNNLRGFELKDGILEANSGENMIYLVSRLVKDFNINVLKPWCALPGTVGGAVVGNAGCFGLEVSDIIISAKLYDVLKNELIEVGKEFLGLEYRNSILKRNDRYFLVSAKFDVSKNIDNFYTDDFRLNKQPVKYISCGSTFKNPLGDAAGRLIDMSGLKGFRIGGAHISELHANFILSDGTATYKDILEIIKHIKQVIFEKFNVNLEEEINIIY